MSHDFKYVNLPGDTLHIGLVFDLVLLKDFDGDFLPSENVRAEADLAKSALPQRPT